MKCVGVRECRTGRCDAAAASTPIRVVLLLVILNDTWQRLITSKQITKWCLLMRQALLEKGSTLFLGMRCSGGVPGDVKTGQLAEPFPRQATVATRRDTNSNSSSNWRRWVVIGRHVYKDVSSEVSKYSRRQRRRQWCETTLIVCKLLQILLQINLEECK